MQATATFRHYTNKILQAIFGKPPSYTAEQRFIDDWKRVCQQQTTDQRRLVYHSIHLHQAAHDPRLARITAILLFNALPSHRHVEEFYEQFTEIIINGPSKGTIQ